MWVIEARGELDLSKKPIGAQRCCEIGVKNFQRDKAFVLSVLRQIDGRHPTTAQLSIDRVRVRERIAQLVDR
jgi:hypothetical protein